MEYSNISDISQLYSHIEIIIIGLDDCSMDLSLEIFVKYVAKNVRVMVFMRENTGQRAARNRGMEAAKGNYVYFCSHASGMEVS